jgi:CubicO group peptidase (beta-lactamase class C family)
MPDLEAVAARVTREVPDLLAEHQLPGIAVGLCDRQGRIWSRGFGVTRNGGNPVGTSTMFSVQSCSKMWAAVAVLAAAQRGLVDQPRHRPGRLGGVFGNRNLLP